MVRLLFSLAFMLGVFLSCNSSQNDLIREEAFARLEERLLDLGFDVSGVDEKGSTIHLTFAQTLQSNYDVSCILEVLVHEQGLSPLTWDSLALEFSALNVIVKSALDWTKNTDEFRFQQCYLREMSSFIDSIGVEGINSASFILEEVRLSPEAEISIEGDALLLLKKWYLSEADEYDDDMRWFLYSLNYFEILEVNKAVKAFVLSKKDCDEGP